VGPDPLATKQTVRASVDGFLKAKKVRDITLDAYQRYEIELNRLITVACHWQTSGDVSGTGNCGRMHHPGNRSLSSVAL